MATEEELFKNIEELSVQLLGLVHAVVCISLDHSSQKGVGRKYPDPINSFECFRILSLLQIQKSISDSLAELSESICQK